MAHVQVRKTPDVIPGQWEVSHEVILLVAQNLADGRNIEATAAHLNNAWSYGEVNGIPAPRIAADGTIIDPDHQRGYSLSEVAAIAALPDTVEQVKSLHEERVRDTNDRRREAKVEQLALARLIKAARAERARNPLLYKQVEALLPVMEWLVDRAFDQCPYEIERVLPELPAMDSEDLRN